MINKKYGGRTLSTKLGKTIPTLPYKKIITNKHGEFDYYIDTSGNVYNKEWNKLSRKYTTKGYVMYALTRNHKSYYLLGHRLVAEMFISNPNNYPEVNHIDGDKNNIDISNLEWCTRSYNMKHAIRNGLLKCPNQGDSIPLTKIREACSMIVDGEKISKISKKLSISEPYLYQLRRGEFHPEIVIGEYNINYTKVNRGNQNKPKSRHNTKSSTTIKNNDDYYTIDIPGIEFVDSKLLDDCDDNDDCYNIIIK